MAKRPRRRRIDALIQSADSPVFAVDAQRRLMLFNAGCERLTGWSADDVLGVSCDYSSEAEPQTVATLSAALCPPPEVFEGKTAHLPATIVTRIGHSYSRLVHFHPILDDDGAVIFVFGTIREMESMPATHRVSASQRVHAELAAARNAVRERYGTSSFLGQGAAMQRVFEQFALARDSRFPVLIVGEAGTGKQHLARAIHAEGSQRVSAFVPIECRRLPAREVRRTLRRLLDTVTEESPVQPPAALPGTVYLKDADALAHDAQELLLQEFETERPPNAHPRFIAAVSNEAFRESLDRELQFRISTIRIELPALRNRPEDLPLLAQAFLERMNHGADRQLSGFAEEVWTQFEEYRWPGNLAELEAVITGARDSSTGNEIEVGDLPFRFRTGLDAQTVGPPIRPNVEPLEEYLAKIEIDRIEDALRQSRQNKAQAAKLLGMTRPRLYRRMQTLGMDDAEDDS